MTHFFTPDQLRNDLARYLECGEQLRQRCESEIVSWRWGTDRMLSPLPYFEQVERGVRGATNWQIVDRRWIDTPKEAKDPVRQGLDARGRLRVFEQGSLHLLLDFPGWTDEIVYYAR